VKKLLEYFQIFSDPTRLKLLKLLSVRPVCVCDLVSALNLSQPAVSNQLRKLRKTGLVSVQRRSHWNFYYLNSEGLNDFIKEFKFFWEQDPDNMTGIEEEWKTFYEMLKSKELKECESVNIETEGYEEG